MNDDVKALIAEARRVVGAPTLKPKVPNLVLIDSLADALEAATVAPAVDREALVRAVRFPTKFRSSGEPERWEAIEWVLDEEDAAEVVEHILASGLLRDVRDMPAVDREALAKVIHERFNMARGKTGVEPLALADQIFASGILRDVRDVQAEALEQAAEQVRGVGGLGSETSGHTSTYSVRNWLRALAQAIREARND